MKESDIKEALGNLKLALRNEDWDLVSDTIDYLDGFLSDDNITDED